MTKFTVLAKVPMEKVPDPPAGRGRTSAFVPVYERIEELHRGEALPISFPDEKAAEAGRVALRKMAKHKGDMLSSSRSADGLTMYFWLEPKETVSQIDRRPAAKSAGRAA